MDAFQRISRDIFRPVTTIVMIIMLSLLTIPPALASPAWMVTDRIPVKGDKFWDHATLQPEQHRLFVAHHDQLVVIDLLTRAKVGSIPGQDLSKAIIVPDLNRGFVTDGEAGNVIVFLSGAAIRPCWSSTALRGKNWPALRLGNGSTTRSTTPFGDAFLFVAATVH